VRVYTDHLYNISVYERILSFTIYIKLSINLTKIITILDQIYIYIYIYISCFPDLLFSIFYNVNLCKYYIVLHYARAANYILLCLLMSHKNHYIYCRTELVERFMWLPGMEVSCETLKQ